MSAIEKSLMGIGKLSNQDRAYLFEAHTDPKTKRLLISQRCEWVNENIPPEIHNLDLVNVDFIDILPRWHDTFFEGGEISGAVRTFPQREQDLLLPQQIKSLLVVPFFEKKLFRGFIGFDNCRKEYVWNEEDKGLLKTVASAIGAALYRQKNHVQLKESEERFRNLLQNISNIAVRGYSRKGIIQYWNPTSQHIYGYSSEEAIGQNQFDLIVPESQKAQVEKSLRDLDNGLAVPSQEVILRTKNGQKVSVLSTYTLVHRPGHPDEYFSLDVDLTEYKSLEQQILRSQRLEAVGSLAGGIAHDLNNVLSPLMMSVGILGASVGKENEHILKIMESSIQRASDMVMQVLSFQRGMSVQKVLVDMNKLLSEFENLLRDMLPKNIAFTCRTRMLLGHVNGDPTQLHQVLLNIAINARDAMPEGGRLILQAGITDFDEAPPNIIGAILNPGEHVVIELQDTGTGMSKEVLLKIFEPFFSTKKEDRGTGLGLATSLAILKSHGGGFTVDSRPGEGTLFKLYLPKIKKSEPELSPKMALESLPRGHSELILIVDDELNIRNLGKGILEEMGYRVLLAENGLEAVKLFEKSHHEISLVITDMMMPVMGGSEAMQQFKKINPEIPIIATSGRSSYICGKDQVPMYADRFIAKPFKSSELVCSVAELINR